MKNKKLPQKYIELKELSLVVEDICRDINLQRYGFEPDVLFGSPQGHHLDLPEWFLIRLNQYINNLKCS